MCPAAWQLLLTSLLVPLLLERLLLPRPLQLLLLLAGQQHYQGIVR
jgi:hypothetical protein